MTTSWQFTEAEFYVLWMDRTGEEPPDPFMFTSPTRTGEDFDTEMREARESLDRKSDGNFSFALDAMINPDLFLIGYAWNEQDRWDLGSLVRVLATRKGPKGYVIKQLPGPTYWRGGGYTVVECDPLRLSGEIVRALPATQRGSRGDIALASSEQDLDHNFGRSVIAAAPDTAISRTTEFLKSPATTVGEIYVVQGRSEFGPRGLTRHLVTFRDVEEDGRYVVTENPAQALAVDEGRFVSVLNSYVAAVIQIIRDERG
ncbi:ESX secretion-associated protein EspG [Nocardia jejuensis]|uniref:ESX secretion-associated protein EspG n=1 Tax=Nocardia jejuensis TaxID=328049 RepID=UPI0008298AB1|nr:ESX secretion-associated protein EspG [Nocardia jejuensis]